MYTDPIPVKLRPLPLAFMLVFGASPVLAAPVEWLTLGDGFWDEGLNWSTAPNLPEAGDDVTINVDGAVVRTITHRQGTTSINSLSSAESLLLSGGELQLGGASTLDAGYAQTGGTLSGVGTLTSTGTATWSGGVMSGTGTSRFEGSLEISGPFFSPVVLTDGRTLDNAGTTTWTSTDFGGFTYGNVIYTGNAARILNDGTWIDATLAGFGTDNSISNGYGGADSVFDNHGTYRKTGNGNTSIAIGFNNSGTVEVDAGTFVLSTGGTHTGSFVIGDGANLTFAGGQHVLEASSSLSGTNFTFGNANLIVQGTYDVTGTTSVTAGSHLLNGTVANLGDTLNLSGGALDIGTLSASVVDYVQTGGTLSGVGTLTSTGTATWSGGVMSGTGTSRFEGSLEISGPYFGAVALTDGRTLDNAGTTTWTSTDFGGFTYGNVIYTGNAARILNDGTWIDATLAGFGTDNSISNGYGGADSVFDNHGTYRKTGNGNTSIAIAFNNSGTVEVDAGTFVLSAGGTHTGSFVIGDGANLTFAGGQHVLEASSSLSGTNFTFGNANLIVQGTYDVTGTTSVTAGSHLLNGTVANLGDTLNLSGGALDIGTLSASVVDYVQTGGTLSGVGTLTSTGTATWSGGVMSGTGTSRFEGSLEISGPYFGAVALTDGRTLDNAGTTTWTSTDFGGFTYGNVIYTGNAARILNDGTWIDATLAGSSTDNSISNGYGGADSVFDNHGTYRKTGNGNTSIAIAFNNSGTVEVDAGTFVLSAGGTHTGSFVIGDGANLTFAGGQHVLEASSSLSGTNFTFGNANLIVQGTYDVTGTTSVTAGSHLLNGTVANLGDTLNLSGGALDIGTLSASVVDYVQTGGTLSGIGTLTSTGTATWSGGVMSGTGTSRFEGSLEISGPYFSPVALTDGRTLDNAGTTTWTSTDFGGTTYSNVIYTGNAARILNDGTWIDATLAGSFTDNFISNGYGGADSVFDNHGTYRKTANGNTSIAIAFNNSGTVEVDAGTLALSAGGTHTGSFDIAESTTLAFSGGNHALVSSDAVLSAGRILINGANTTVSGSFVNGGLLDVQSGILQVDGSVTTVNYTQTGGTLSGIGTLTSTGTATWSGGVMSGTGSSRFEGSLEISGPFFSPVVLTDSRTLDNAGTTTWTSTDFGGFTYGNVIYTGNAARILNDGIWIDATLAGLGTDNSISNGYGGADSVFDNHGTYRKTGNGNTSIAIGFNNSGTVEIENGTFNLTGNVLQHGSEVLSGGTWRVSADGNLGLNGFGAQDITTNQGDVTLDGAGANFARINALVNNQGAFRLLGGRNFTAPGAFTNSGVLQLGGGSFAAPSLSNTNNGEIFGFGTITPTVLNSGVVRAAGGTLTVTGGIDGQSGTLQSDAGATLALGANSDGDVLVNNGTLALGTFNVTVDEDYRNANFGSGNAFNARANVTGSGQILASGDVAQALTGDVTGGTGGTPQMAFGNIHVGDVVNRVFQVANTGTSGPALRGALQTAVNGGNLTDGRLTGTGAEEGEFGAVVAGTASDNFVVTFTGSSAGALSGQSMAVVNNFDNVAEQVLGISGAVYRYANPSAHTPEPVVFANARVGDLRSQALTLSNDVEADGFSEALDASIGDATAGITTHGNSISMLAAGATDSTSLVVGIDTSTAGAKVGTATISLASNGSGTSGLGITDLGTQTVNVSGDVYRLASASPHSPSPVAFGNRRVGDAASQALTLTNTAAADGFSESLNASIGGATGNVTTNGGSISLLAAGATNNTNLVVTLDTSTAGAKSGTATISLASDGTGTSGFSAFDLGTQTVNVSGDVYRLASAGPHSPSPVVFANRHVGDAASQVLSLTNTAAADGFSESLNASIGGATGNVTTNGGSISLLAAGATNNSNLVVTLDTATAGAKSGTATISLASDGAGTSGFSAFDLGTQTVDVSGNVYRYAEAGAIAAVVFGNVHVGASVSQALSLSNIAAADGFSESLNAVFEGSSDARILTAGSVSGLAAGATDSSSLVVSLDTSSAGALTGFTSLRLTSDGAGTSELGLTDLGVRNVGVTTNVAVYRFAEATIDTAQPIDFGAFRVGDVAGDVALAVSNTATIDGFSEALNADIGSVSSGFNAAGSISLLAAGQSNGAALSVGLDTATSGDKSGSVSVDFVSDGSGTSGLGQTALASQSVAVQGRVYQQAVANVETTAIDFGIVHVGDTVGSRSISIRNDANGALNDSLRGSVLGAAAGFDASGSLGINGLAAGASSTAIGIALDTSVAGFFAGNAVLGFASHNAEMSDLDLGTANVALNAAVFNYANPVLNAVGGDGSFSAVGTSFTLDFGTLTQGSSGLLGLLALTNLVAGPADDLGATFDLGSGPFALTGFADFNGLGAQDRRSLTVGFDALTAGLFEQVIGIELFGENASGYFGSLGTFELTIRAEVAPVPVPAAVWMFGSALAGLWGARRRRIGYRR